MAENGVEDKDQLQCRTHGQKYMLQIVAIAKSIADSETGAKMVADIDKKMFQKL